MILLHNTFFTKKLLLSKIVLFSLFKRFYPGPTRMQNSVTLLQQRLYTNKLVLLHFCNHFKKIPLTDLTKDTVFIEWVDKCIRGTPTLQSRAFQLALEVTYNKRFFSESTLQKFYKNDFQIEDIYNINKGLCDQSTIYIASLGKIFSYHLNTNKKDLIINSTPLFMKKSDITSERQEIMDSNKKMTDNSMPDMSFREQSFDCKDSKNICWNKNHIYFVDIAKIEQQGYGMLKNLSASLHNQIKINALSPQGVLYAQDILKLLQYKETSFQKMFEKINAYTLVHQPPKDFRMPYIIPIKKADSELLKTTFTSEQVEKVNLEPGNLTDVKAKKAIESIQEDWDSALKETVQKAISSSLSHVLINDETI